MATLASLLVKVGVRLDGAIKAEQSITRIKGRANDLSKELTPLGKGFRSVGKYVSELAGQLGGQLKESFQGVDVQVAGMTMRLGGLPGAVIAVGKAAIGVAKQLFDFIDAQTASIDTTNKLATALGIPVEELQRLEFAAGQSGLNFEKFRATSLKLNAALKILKERGSGPAVEAFKELGISLQDLEGKSRTDQLGLIGDRLNLIGNEAERSATAARIFGEEAGPAMASMLAAGTQGLRELTAQAQGVFSKEDADRASAFQDRMGEVKNMLKAVATTVAVELLPAVYDVIVGVRDWIKSNQGLIQQGIPAFIAAISVEVTRLRDELRGMVELVNAAAGAFSFLGVESNNAAAKIAKIAAAFIRLSQPIDTVTGRLETMLNLLAEIGILARQIDTKNLGLAGESAGAQALEGLKNIRRSPRGGLPLLASQADSGLQLGSAILARGKKTTGGGGGKGAKGPKEKKEKPGIEWMEAIAALQGGNVAVLEERLKGMAAGSPEARDIKPTVAMTVNITNHNADVDVVQHFNTPDPVAAGRESANSIDKLFAKAGLALPNGTVR